MYKKWMLKSSFSSFVQTLKKNGWNCLLKSVFHVRKTGNPFQIIQCVEYVTTWMFFRVKRKRKVVSIESRK
jgi:hypothetical protein